jgi:cytochrome P450
MAWMVAYLVQRPDFARRLLDEARANPGLAKTPQAVKAFRWAEAFFRESLRLHPPAVLTTRRLLRPLEVEGVHLPAGTVVAIPLWLFSRDPNAFVDPERFEPERWLREERRLTPLETSAFGAGPHFCLGYHMAWVEAVQFIVALVRAMDDAGLKPSMTRLPRERYLPLLRPRVEDTGCRFVRGTFAGAGSPT